jgi:putative ABC transport system permease protein
MQGLLFGVGPLDAMAFATAPAVLIPIAVVACLVPAARAAATDPADALRRN